MLRRLVFACFACLLPVAACAPVQSDPQFSDRTRDGVYRNGSLVSRDGGWTVMGGGAVNQTGSQVAVDPTLWRAALATVATLPVSTADQARGIIDTDWDSESADARTRLHIVVTDTVVVTQVRQVRQRGKGGDAWVDTPDDGTAAQTLQAQIMHRAGR